MFSSVAAAPSADLPKLERVLERSMMACLLGLFNTERLAREISAVTRVMDILSERQKQTADTMMLIRRYRRC